MPTPPRPPEPRSGVDRALVKALKDREERGVPANTVDGTVIVGFNDPAALAQALERRDVAIVLTEAAITNTIGLLLPVDGFTPSSAA
jgi:glutamate-1-semialdehyde aminotransferase